MPQRSEADLWRPVSGCAALLKAPGLCPPRYKSLCPDTWPHWRGPPAEGVERLIKYIGYSPEEYKLGR